MQGQHRFNTKAWLLWTAGFVAFFIGGALAMGVVGRVNDFGSALVGGMVAGAGYRHWPVAGRPPPARQPAGLDPRHRAGHGHRPCHWGLGGRLWHQPG